jgi:tRNA threonylcarbamoyladenosine biosynthesis protein TsaE
MIVRTTSPEQTEALGAALLRLLPPGSLVALRGDLASGKTCLVRGMASALTTHEAVHSPTFTLVNQYGTRHPLYHLDLYRLNGPDELADLGYEELFDSTGVCVIEWAERAEAILPPQRLDITLSHVDEHTRELVFENHGMLGEGWEGHLPAML